MIFQYEAPGGPYKLTLDSEDRSLRPWDAADEYLLSLPETLESERILIAGDRYGALSVPLAERGMARINDSLTEQRQCSENLKANGRPLLPELNSMEEIPGNADLILIRVPKSLEAFRWLLLRLQEGLKKDCPVKAAGMNRYLPKAFYDLFCEFTQDAEYSRIQKKARYYSGRLKAESIANEPLPVPSAPFSYREREFFSYPAVFSQGRVDGGSRLLLDWLFEKGLSAHPDPALIADPGCGYGILGLCALGIWRDARLIATDDNAQAVASTLENGLHLKLDDRLTARQDNVLDSLEDESVDLVICNPPFHMGHTVSTETGFAFLKGSARVLKKEGLFLGVFNKNLGYGNRLQELFSSVKTVKDNKKYRVILCQK